MHRRTASTALITLLLLLLNLSAAWALDVKITGYFPGGYKSKHQARIEGGPHDRYGRPLRTLQKYDGSYVSAATDPRIIKSGTIFYLKEFPNIKFLACDVGKGVKGYHVDIACQSEKHTYQLPKRAKIIKKEHFKIMNKRKKGENNFLVIPPIAYIELSTGEYALIDEEDLKRVSKYFWQQHNWGYPRGIVEGKRQYMHRVVMNAPEGTTIDHINGNTLDNRKCNLRFCTMTQNSINSKLNPRNKSGFRGVWWDEKRQKYEAYLRVDKKKKHLGRYSTIEAAARAYMIEAVKHYGEFVRLANSNIWEE